MNHKYEVEDGFITECVERIDRFYSQKKGNLIKFIAVTGGKADFYTLPKEKSDFLKMLFNTFLVTFNVKTIIYSMLPVK